MNTPHTKSDLRDQYKQIRDEFVQDHDAQALSLQLLDLFLKSHLVPEKDGFAGPVIAGYWPVGSEIDCLPILTHYWKKGNRCALPAMQGEERLLTFRQWTPDVPLMEGKFKILTPPSTQLSLVPGTLLVPLLAFDLQGNRLGLGGGYFDATIAYYRSFTPLKAIGLAFDCQETDLIPTQKGDQYLDYIVTPTRVITPPVRRKPRRKRI